MESVLTLDSQPRDGIAKDSPTVEIQYVVTQIEMKASSFAISMVRHEKSEVIDLLKATCRSLL
jgi:hypothetical protein